MKKQPQRKCVGCGHMKDKRDLIRVLKDEEGIISVDLTGRKNGRGAYLCRDQACLKMAEKNHGLEHSLKTRIEDSVDASLEAQFQTFPSGENDSLTEKRPVRCPRSPAGAGDLGSSMEGGVTV